MAINLDSDISVVVAAYGDVPYLEATLTSLVNTQPPEVPLYVLDDASPTNEVREVVKPFLDRINYIRSEKNRGVSGSFNAAADLVTSKYLMLVGPDDLVTSSLPAFLNTLPQEALESVVIQPGVTVIDSFGNPSFPINDRVKNWIAPQKNKIHSNERLAISLLKGDWAYNPSLVWNVEYLRQTRYNESLLTAMDLDILLRLSFEGKTLYRSSKKVFEYRRHSGAVSSRNAGIQQFGEELRIHKFAFEESSSRHWARARVWAKLAATPRLHALLLAVSSTAGENKSLLRMIRRGINFEN